MENSKMRKFFLALILTTLFTTSAYATEGMISIKSMHTVAVTADRL